MAGKFEINQDIQQRDHGKIFLYQRVDHKQPKWQARIKIDGAKDLIRFSTKTSDKSIAWQRALERYQSHVDALRLTGSTKPKTFNEIAEKWFEFLKKSNIPDGCVNDYESRIRNYPMVFWADEFIKKIGDADLIRFINWRKNHGKNRTHPSVSTIKRDLVPLKLFFRWAYSEKHILQRLTFDRMVAPSVRRPHFEDDEWKELVKKLDDWIRIVKGDQKLHVRNRTYLKYYVLILGYTGIRPGTEVQAISWNSIIKKVVTNERKTAYILHISDGKTGPRTIILNVELNDHIDALKNFRKNELKEAGKVLEKNEAIFCNYDGTPTLSFKKGFATFLKKYKLEINFSGDKRVPYSLRHTFASRMIGYGTNHWDLAKYMGTSVALLEKYYVHDNHEAIGDNFFDPNPNKGRTLKFDEVESLDKIISDISHTHIKQSKIEL